MVEEAITNVPQYLDACLKLARASADGFWFRGHRRADFALKPGLYRNMRPIRDARGNPVGPDFVGHSSGTEYAYPNFAAMLVEFKRLATPHLQSMNRAPVDEFEWIFLMQHYGVKTRLLDWTTDPLIALFFAVQPHEGGDRKWPPGDAEVHLLDPVGINLAAQDHPAVITLSEAQWGRYIDPREFVAQFPICVAPAHIDPRIIAQSSMFTLHGADLRALDDFQPYRSSLRQLTIAADRVDDIRRDLELLGYDRARVFPELSTIADRVLRAGERRFSRFEVESSDL